MAELGSVWRCALLTVLLGNGLEAGEVWELEPYEVSGWRMEEAIWRTAGVVTEVGGDVLEESGGVLEGLRIATNVGIRKYNESDGEGELSLRGYGENSGLRVLVLVDGMKMNGPDMGGVDWQALPVEEVEMVEVLRGGQAVVYGQHAMGGVVRIETRMGRAGGVGVRGRAGSDGLRSGSGWVSGAVGLLGYRIGVQRSHLEGYREHAENWSETVHGSLRHAAMPGLEILWRGGGGEYDISYPGPLDYEAAMRSPRRSYTVGEQGTEGKRWRHSLRVRRWLSWGETEWTGGWQAQMERFALDGLYARRRHSGRSFGGRVKVGSEATFLLSGVELVGDRLGLTVYDGMDQQWRSSVADLKRDTVSGYVFGQVQVRPQWVISSGVRYEWAGTDYKNAVFDPRQVNPLDPVIWDPNRPNPFFKEKPDILSDGTFDERLERDGLAWEASLVGTVRRKGRVWLGWDRTYRYPVLDEVASYQGYRLREPLNRELRAEMGDQIEAGWDWRTDSASLSMAVFQTWVEDEIVYDEGIGLNTNIGRTRRSGAELGLRMEAGRWAFAGNWQYVEARLDSGENAGRRVPLVPVHRMAWMLKFQAGKRLRLGLDLTVESMRYQGNDYANESRVLDSYALLGAGARWEISERASLFLRGSNLMDRRYLSTAFNGSYYPGVGRQVEISLTWRH